MKRIVIASLPGAACRRAVSLKFFVALALSLAFSLALNLAPRAFAAAVSPSDLFLAPSSIADDLYPEHVLPVGGEKTYTSADVGGVVTGVKILPLLVANPSTFQGEYTTSDLANITVSNYSQYFAAQPDVDYFADLTGDTVTLDYAAPGSYMVQISATDASAPFNKLYIDFVDDAIGENPGAGVPKDKKGVNRLMKPGGKPKADLIVVSNQAKEGAAANGYTANALATLKDEKKNVVTADKLDDVVMAIMAESVKQGKAITVDLVGHGTPGTILMGMDLLAAKGGAMTPKDFGTALKGKVTNINFYSCNTGQGQAGQTFAKDVTDAAMIPSIGAFNTVTSAFGPTPGFNTIITFVQTRFGIQRVVTVVPNGKINPGWFDVGGTGVLGSLVPEPTALTLLACAVTALASRRKRGGGKRKGPLS